MAQSFVFARWRQSLLARGSLRECDVTDDRLYAGLLLEQVVHHFQQRLSTRAVRPSATHVAWSVCLSVCLSQQYCEPYTRLNRAKVPMRGDPRNRMSDTAAMRSCASDFGRL